MYIYILDILEIVCIRKYTHIYLYLIFTKCNNNSKIYFNFLFLKFYFNNKKKTKIKYFY